MPRKPVRSIEEFAVEIKKLGFVFDEARQRWQHPSGKIISEKDLETLVSVNGEEMLEEIICTAERAIGTTPPAVREGGV